MDNFKHLSIKEQVHIFKSKGMKFDDEDKAKRLLEYISYYKIKEFAMPFYGEKKYENICFEDILIRFEEDRNIRSYFMRYCEILEIALKTQFSRIISKRYGIYEYADFKKWCDTSIEDEEIENNQKRILKNIENNIKKSDNVVIKNYEKKNNTEQTIFIAVETMTFGEIIDMYRLLNKNDKGTISKFYGLDYNDYLVYIENMKDIRNLSAHNKNVIDLEFVEPIEVGCDILENITSKNKIAVSIYILQKMISSIDPSLLKNKIRESLRKICKDDDKLANNLGFESCKQINKLKI